MKIDKCKTSSSRGFTNQPLALGRVFVVVVAVVVLVVAFLTGRSVSCDEAGAVSGETDSSDAGSFLLGELSDKLVPFSCWQSRASWEWAESVPDSFESWAWSRRLLAAPPVRGCWAGAVDRYTSSGRGSPGSSPGKLLRAPCEASIPPQILGSFSAVSKPNFEVRKMKENIF